MMKKPILNTLKHPAAKFELDCIIIEFDVQKPTKLTLLPLNILQV
jgi:hypothetical protein